MLRFFINLCWRIHQKDFKAPFQKKKFYPIIGSLCVYSHYGLICISNRSISICHTATGRKHVLRFSNRDHRQPSMNGSSVAFIWDDRNRKSWVVWCDLRPYQFKRMEYEMIEHRCCCLHGNHRIRMINCLNYGSFERHKSVETRIMNRALTEIDQREWSLYWYN